MHENKSFNRNPANHALYHALIEYLIEDENAIDKSESPKKPSTTKEIPKGKAPSKGSKTGKSASAKESVEEPIAEVVMDNAFKTAGKDVEWNKRQVVLDQPEQPWFNQMVYAMIDPLTLNDLMATPIDFSKYVLNRLKIDKLTQDLLLGPAYNLLKGTCSSNIELEYNFQECRPGHLTITIDYFFNNDLEYLKTSDLEKTYTKSITKTKESGYEIVGIEDMVPTLWSTIKHAYDKDAAKGIKHWGERRKLWYRSLMNKFSKHNVYSTQKNLGVKSVSVNKLHGCGHLEEVVVKRADRQLYKFKEGNLVDLHLNDIEDMLLLAVQHKLFHLNESDIVDFIVALRMFTRSLIIKHRVEDLQLGNRRDLPRDIPLDRIEVLGYDTKGVKVRKGKMQTKTELALEQTQQGVSDEILVSIKGVEELKRNVKIKDSHHGPTYPMYNPSQPLKVSQKTLVSFLTDIKHIAIDFLTPNAPVIRTASAAAKPCQGDSLEFYQITAVTPSPYGFVWSDESQKHQWKVASSARTPQQNGVVERKNRMLVEAARIMLIFSCALLFLWAEAIATACYTKNRSIIHRRFNKTPYEFINGRKLDISFLHVFGALCYPKNDREDLGKLGAKGDIGFFIGYSANSCAYRVYNRRKKKVIETMNVTFDELSAMAFEQRSSKPGLQSMTSRQINSGLELTYAPSTITSQKPTEHNLDLLFETMYDDYIGGQPSATAKTSPAAQVHQVLQTSMVTTTTADTALTLTNSSSKASDILNSSQDVDELEPQQQHVQQQDDQALI
ncbi:retrovirus-related pol polyprotein from transposon TNT 1-94 [Tanacetum coccineum]